MLPARFEHLEHDLLSAKNQLFTDLFSFKLDQSRKNNKFEKKILPFYLMKKAKRHKKLS